MSGPFRFEPPAWRDDLLVRPRLLDRMAQRWSRRLLTVVAGPGFGKTALLVSAMRRTAPGCSDTWLACEPRDAEAGMLLADLAAAFGLGDGADFDDLASEVWLKAPSQVCFVIDDVHEVPAGSDGAETLARLVAELPRNAHLVLASRSPVPVPLGRLAARRDLERVVEADLAFDDGELEAFAASRSVEVSLLASGAGWPAIVELAATAGADLVDEYLWEEVLSTLGPDRSHDLARFAVAGGGDDAVARALVTTVGRVDDLVAGVPLVNRSASGWMTLHPLWIPALRRILSIDEADDCRRRAAAVHRDAGRYELAVDLYVDAEAWDEVLVTIRRAELEPWSRGNALLFGRWYRTLPPDRRDEPAARFAAAIELAARRPLAAVELLRDAAEAFRASGDIDGEVAVICHDGLIRWWANDVDGLAELFDRVVVLAAGGSAEAKTLMSIGVAAIAHIGADSAGVTAALESVDCALLDPGWLASVEWLRHVAYRRAGDLDLAELVLDRTGAHSAVSPNSETALARLQIAWLRGQVDHVRDALPRLEVQHRAAGNHYLHVEVCLELAVHLAWLGETDRARELLDDVSSTMPDMPGALTSILHLATVAVLAVESGDEPAAVAALSADPLAKAGRPDNWYWRDRSLVALPYVLLADQRRGWEEHTTHPLHRGPIELARLLIAARDGDLSGVGRLRWPDSGLVRAHLPVRWIAELIAAGCLAGNPPPPDLLDAVGSPLRGALSAIASDLQPGPVAVGARRVLAVLAESPVHAVSIGVVGPLEVRIDGAVVDHPDLRRRRVRELLGLLVVRRSARRDAIADALWPESSDARHNLRVTLNYLRNVLEPDRDHRQASGFVVAGHDTLTLLESGGLGCDLWQLDGHLGAAAEAERLGDPRRALEEYLAALPLWRGEAFDDIADLDWARDEQTSVRNRYARAAVRAGDLLLADGRWADAASAGEHATRADPTNEAGYAVVARGHLAAGSVSQARQVIDACIRALAEIDASPGPAITVLSVEVDQRLHSLTIR